MRSGENEAMKVWTRANETAVLDAPGEGPKFQRDAKGSDPLPARKGGVQDESTRRELLSRRDVKFSSEVPSNDAVEGAASGGERL